MATMHRVNIVLSGSALPQGGLATHYFDYPSSGAQAALDAAMTLWRNFGALMNPGLTFTADPIVSQVDPADGAIFGVTACTGDTDDGSSANDIVTNASQLLVQWRTGVYLNGREVRGRTFVPAVTENYATNGEVDSGIVAGLTSDLTDYITILGVVPVIWHRPGPHGAGSSVPIAAGTVWNEFAVLRDRR